ncbi:MAG: LLM class F420-dependent oxidoreductase [Myxococcota bacterium]
MKIGLFLPLAGPTATAECAATFATEAEVHGFDSVWIAERVVLFDEYGSRYPYAEDGLIPVGGEAGFLDPLGALCFLAGKTSRIRLGTGICLVPQRNPVYTAKEVATADVLSGGRVDFGVGVGWLAEEFRAVAAPFERRGTRTRSYLEVMRRLWCDEVSEYKDEFYELPACRQYPKPVQQPHPPIHFGGESEAALRRVADIGQGWYGFNLDPPELKEHLGRLEALLAERGRQRRDVQVSVSPYLKGCDEAKLAAYAEAGADQVILTALVADESSVRSTVEELAGSLLRAAREL